MVITIQLLPVKFSNNKNATLCTDYATYLSVISLAERYSVGYDFLDTSTPRRTIQLWQQSQWMFGVLKFVFSNPGTWWWGRHPPQFSLLSVLCNPARQHIVERHECQCIADGLQRLRCHPISSVADQHTIQMLTTFEEFFSASSESEGFYTRVTEFIDDDEEEEE